MHINYNYRAIYVVMGSLAFLATSEPAHHHLEDEESSGVDWYTPHHTDSVSSEEGFNALALALVVTVQHSAVLSFNQVVGLDEGLYVVNGIDEGPISNSC